MYSLLKARTSFLATQSSLSSDSLSLGTCVSLWIIMGHECTYTPSSGSSVKYLRVGRTNQRPLCKHLKAEITFEVLPISASAISKILERAK